MSTVAADQNEMIESEEQETDNYLVDLGGVCVHYYRDSDATMLSGEYATEDLIDALERSNEDSGERQRCELS